MDASNAITTRFSPYLVLEYVTNERINNAGGGHSPPPASPVPMQHLSCHITSMSLSHACKAIISCIKQEKGYNIKKFYYNDKFLLNIKTLLKFLRYSYYVLTDWKVLHLILRELPQVMQNRALVLSRYSNDIDLFAAALCSMVS